MIEFFSETDFTLETGEDTSCWISQTIQLEGFEEGDISYIFCDDEYLHKLNVEFLSHDTLTDIISFDNSMGKQLHGEMYISVERVKENAEEYTTDFLTELHRVMIHGILHFCGFGDKTEEESEKMHLKENEALQRAPFLKSLL